MGPKIGLIGAGAVGCYVVMSLGEKYGDQFMLIAKGERKERLLRDGLSINGRRYSPRVLSPEQAAKEGLDYLIVALKYTSLKAALSDIAGAVSEETTVVSLMNGIDSEEIIGERIGMEHMLYSFIKIASTRHGNSVSFPLPEGRMGIHVGEAPGKSGERALSFQALFEGTPAICHVEEEILPALWDKLGVNIARNLPQAVLGVGTGAYDDSTYVQDLCRKLRHEVVMVAAAKGIRISEDFYYAPCEKMQRYSTLQDLDAGRETEIEMFSGALIRTAKALGVSCPYNEVIYDLIKALEEKNAGRFDYRV